MSLSGAASENGGSLSRAQSIINLTASTLFGIFAPTTSEGGKGRSYSVSSSVGGGLSGLGGFEDTGTPWGTGAQTPTRRPDVDDSTYELMRDRSSQLRRRGQGAKHGGRRRSSLAAGPGAKGTPPSTAELAIALTMRAALLFLLGMGYGALVTRLRTAERLDLAAGPSSGDGRGVDRYEGGWRYMALWGAAGVALGALLPWFDGVWEDAFGAEDDAGNGHDDIGHDADVDGRDAVGSSGDGGALRAAAGKVPSFGTDWALVVRSVGAFVGIVFAIVSSPPGPQVLHDKNRPLLLTRFNSTTSENSHGLRVSRSR
jgi:hypothetical protein